MLNSYCFNNKQKTKKKTKKKKKIKKEKICGHRDSNPEYMDSKTIVVSLRYGG